MIGINRYLNGDGVSPIRKYTRKKDRLNELLLMNERNH